MRAKSVGSDAQGSRLEPGSTSLQIPLLYPGAMTVSVDIGDQGLVDQKIFATVKLVQLKLQATSKTRETN